STFEPAPLTNTIPCPLGQPRMKELVFTVPPAPTPSWPSPHRPTMNVFPASQMACSPRTNARPGALVAPISTCVAHALPPFSIVTRAPPSVGDPTVTMPRFSQVDPVPLTITSPVEPFCPPTTAPRLPRYPPFST